MIPPVKIQVRFSDLDVMGHVNNSVYLSYFEYARVYYFGILLGKEWDWNSSGVLLVKNEVEYLIPILLNDTPEITIGLENIGTKSFCLNYEIRVNGKLTTTGKSTLVSFDVKAHKSIEIPEQMKLALLQLKRNDS